jgi:hypothetical protein
VAQGYARIGIGEQSEVFGDEGIAGHALQGIEDVLIEHIPSSDLLLHHVEAGLLEIHRHWSCSRDLLGVNRPGLKTGIGL